MIYPHGTFNTFNSPDPHFQLAMARNYNDYYHEIFGSRPDRFVVSGVVPMMDIEGATAEAVRLGKMGYRSVSIPMQIPALPYNQPDYAPFWSAVEEMEIPLALHIFTEGEISDDDAIKRAAPGEDLAFEVIDMAAAMHPLCLLVASGYWSAIPSCVLCWSNAASVGWRGFCKPSIRSTRNDTCGSDPSSS